ncbi:HD-GYP domain-containing protein [Cytobacillus spongiae]|jgi:HD-GYP domain-containing protein (c-di-GMP phosphodiesterase class II)|uniref:HD-GYP domain-containing protein n=1 Tax=Cytobacillus spongiae TaxID=2901381 RepID=UPI001F280A69|nr:HD-GYP domain-containing protein [Cytobacillus spongiae]UII54140.1 HD-GYP domain-containing protein [Cytobacillus spongiae]
MKKIYNYHKDTLTEIEIEQILMKQYKEEFGNCSPSKDLDGMNHLKSSIRKACEELSFIFEMTKLTKEIQIQPIQQKVVPEILKITKTPYISYLIKLLHQSDPYTAQHNISVAILSGLLGKWLRLSEEHLRVLITGAVLHDIGKLCIPERILNKPGRLTNEEFSVIKMHPIYGYHLLLNQQKLQFDIPLIALQHHERMDGSGYPYNLKGNEITTYAKIVGVVDVFHAMASDRVYRKALPFYQIMDEMSKGSYGLLDMKITTVFIRGIMTSLIGEKVLLSTGKMGIILSVHQSDPLLPLIKVQDTFIDLMKDRSIQISKIGLFDK